MLLEFFSDPQVGLILSRLGNAVFLLLVAIELIASVKWVGNKRLTKLVAKTAAFVLTFFFLRVIASFVDNYTGTVIGWASNIVNLVFWSVIIYRLDQIRVILKHDKNAETRKELRALTDNLLDKLELAKANLTELKHLVQM